MKLFPTLDLLKLNVFCLFVVVVVFFHIPNEKKHMGTIILTRLVGKVSTKTKE